MGVEFMNYSYLLSIIKRCRIFYLRYIVSLIKRISMYHLGFRASSTAYISWSASADGGGGGGKIDVGENSSIDIGVILRANGNKIIIGKNSSINAYTLINGGGGVIIGDGVRIASHCSIISGNHNFLDVSTPIYLQGETMKGIIIEDDVWVGAGVSILDGLTISKGSVIGAGSVVTKSTKPYSINVGVPSAEIKIRGRMDLVKNSE